MSVTLHLGKQFTYRKGKMPTKARKWHPSESEYDDCWPKYSYGKDGEYKHWFYQPGDASFFYRELLKHMHKSHDCGEVSLVRKSSASAFPVVLRSQVVFAKAPK